MKKSQKEKLATFFKEYESSFDSDLQQFIRENMDSFLKGGTHVDVLAQVAYAIGEKPQNGDLFEEYFAFLKENYELTDDILEVGSGYYPAFASMIDEYQTEKKKGSIEIYDPKLIVTRKGNIRINKEYFDSTIDTSRFKLITAMFPCEPTLDIIEKANYEDKDFSILLCECVPSGGYPMFMTCYSSNAWRNHIYHVAKSTLKPDRAIDVAYVSKVKTPIIYSKRKR